MTTTDLVTRDVPVAQLQVGMRIVEQPLPGQVHPARTRLVVGVQEQLHPAMWRVSFSDGSWAGYSPEARVAVVSEVAA